MTSARVFCWKMSLLFAFIKCYKWHFFNIYFMFFSVFKLLYEIHEKFVCPLQYIHTVSCVKFYIITKGVENYCIFFTRLPYVQWNCILRILKRKKYLSSLLLKTDILFQICSVNTRRKKNWILSFKIHIFIIFNIDK